MNFIQKYGYCLIPEGTILIRTGKNYKYNGCMFFGLDRLGGCSIRQDDAFPQVWRVMKSFIVLFMVDHVTRVPNVISSIVDIYNTYYPDENVDDLDIKQRDLQKRNKLLNILKSEEIIGWLSSLENNYVLEICLFPDTKIFESLISPLPDFDVDDYSYHNALNDISIYPSDEFYRKSADHCNNIQEYKQWFCLQWEDKNHEDLPLFYKRHLNLRLKLGI